MNTKRVPGRTRQALTSLLSIAVATCILLGLGFGSASAQAQFIDLCYKGKTKRVNVHAVSNFLEKGARLGACDAPEVCGPCGLNFDPVTCANGKTYANSCFAECDGQAGPCERLGVCSNIWNPVTCTAPDGSTKTYANACQAANAGATSCGAACACPQIYAPVRCSDGKVYVNACVAECNGSSGCTEL